MKTKQVLRKKMQGIFREKDSSYLQKKEREIYKEILEFIEEKHLNSIALFIGTQNEPQTRELIEKLFSLGKKVFLPKVLSSSEMQFIEIQNIRDLKVGKFGILEPMGENYSQERIDVFFVPGIAFTRGGKRLGKGKGYYDRFLSQELYKNSLKVGVCYDFQLVDDIPTDEWDVRMDKVIFTN